MQSIIIAFSTYSKIPMPHIPWNQKGMQYSMCAFPLVGVVIFACGFGMFVLLSYVFPFSDVGTAAVLTVLPVLMNGGIHMDGFLDTVDARASYKPKEEKLQILKDPHTGAFAIIHGICYMLLYFGFMTELVGALRSETRDEALRLMGIFAIGGVLERALSGLSVLTFRKAKPDGMVADTARDAQIWSKVILLLWIVVCAAGGMLLQPVAASAMLAAALLVFLYYRIISYRVFGGVTGDLAGYFLQLCELSMLIALTVLCKVYI